ncbi:MAG: pitrilysin family protein [Candidatus Omnitrophota bacterium]
MYELDTLKNGTRCSARSLPDRDSLAIGVWLGVGGRYEPKKISGVSHFIEHLLFKGTKKRSAEDIKQQIEGRGGAMNGFTSEEFTCYLVKVLNRDMENALDVLSDMVFNARFSPGDIKKERHVIKEEIKLYVDLPNHHVHDLLMELLWPEQALGRNLAGTLETVTSMTRDDIYGYKRKYYNPRNVVISACGNLDTAELFSCCDKYFGCAKDGNRASFKKADDAQRRPMLKILSKKTEQAHMAIGLRAFGRNDPDRYALTLLHIILGGNMSSRLFREVREKKGLAYEIGTSVKKLHDTGAFIVSAGLDNRNIAKTLDIIMRELNRIRTKDIGKGEFERAREFYRGQMLLGLEDTIDQMLWMGEHLSSKGDIPTPQEVVQKIASLTPDDVKRAAKRIIENSRLNMALIGTIDKSQEKEISKALNIG